MFFSASESPDADFDVSLSTACAGSVTRRAETLESLNITFQFSLDGDFEEIQIHRGLGWMNTSCSGGLCSDSGGGYSERFVVRGTSSGSAKDSAFSLDFHGVLMTNDRNPICIGQECAPSFGYANIQVDVEAQLRPVSALVH
jgi:hypothetical protein